MGRKARAIAPQTYSGELWIDEPGNARAGMSRFTSLGGRLVAARHDCKRCNVRRLGVCAALQEADLPQLGMISSYVVLPPGSKLFGEGDRVSSVYNVIAGTLRLFRVLPDGRRQITAFGFAGDFLGLFPRDVYPYTAEAVDRVHLCRFPAPGMWSLKEKFPALERRMLEMGAEELVAAHDRMLLLGRKTPLEKTASFLREVSLRQERIGLRPSPVSLSMTRGDIADYLGLTVETVSRCFTRLRLEKVIWLPEPAMVKIRDPRRLDAIASGYTNSVRSH